MQFYTHEEEENRETIAGVEVLKTDAINNRDVASCCLHFRVE